MKKLVSSLCLVLTLSVTLFAQDVSKALQLLQQAMDALQPPVVVVPPAPIATPEAFALALASDVPTITLSRTFINPTSVTITRTVTIQGEDEATVAAGTRVTREEALPRFNAGISITGSDVLLRGIDVRQTSPTGTLFNVSGTNVRLDRVRGLGDALTGVKRGVAYTGSNGVLTNCYIADVFQPAQDTQAVYSDNMGAGTLTIDNCYLQAAGEVVMFGGADPATPDRQPHDVTLTNSTLDKRAEWTSTNLQQVKCSLELKNIRGFRSTGCVFLRGGGISQGQGGYAFDLTVRNQNGQAPESCVQDVVIEDFLVDAPGSGVASISGYDSNFPSGKLHNLVIRRGTVTNVDHNALPGTTGRLFTFDHAPELVTIQDVMVKGVNIKSIMYFQGLLPPTGLVVSNVTVDNGGVVIPYRYKLDGNTHAVGVSWPTNIRAALLAYMPDALLDANVF